MTFEEHLEQTRKPNGDYDLAAAQEARAEELSNDPEAVDDLAQKAASSERRAWESSNRQRLAAQFKLGQGALDFGDLDPLVLVPLGDNVAVSMTEMDAARIRIRKDLRTEKHLEENRAFDAEMEFWFEAERRLPPGGTLGDIS